MNSQASNAISTSIEANTLREKVSVVVFFLVAFGVPWTTMLIVMARHIAFSELSAPFMLSAAFCSVGGVVATYVDTGRSGLKALARRCLLYQVPVVWWAWHFAILFHSVSADALFFASAVALSILMTVLFLHTRGSVLLAIVMHWSGTPGKEIARICLSAHEPPDWVRAVVLITIAA